MEDACGMAIDAGPLRDLRRLIYFAEWIESHSLHVRHLARRDPPLGRGLRLHRPLRQRSPSRPGCRPDGYSRDTEHAQKLLEQLRERGVDASVH
jgi:hypothetical protein